MADPNAIPRKPEPRARPGWKLRLERRLGLLGPVEVLPFRSFGTPERLHVRGRVREKKSVSDAAEPASFVRNVLDSLHRIASDEIPGARLRARFGDVQCETSTDGEGYFVLDVEPESPLAGGWHHVTLELVASVGEPERASVEAPVLVPAADARFGVISDIDDTIVLSRSTDLLRQTAIIFGKGARERLPFPGVPALYRALAGGPDGRGANPIFYVSRSGWNLVDLFEHILEANGMPAGPFFLSDLRVVEEPSEVLGTRRHKWEAIDLLMRTYPELPFVLIGDSGMRDPELYREVSERYPERVLAVYIHDVTGEARDREVDAVAEALAERGVPMLRMQDTRAAADHARELGLIGEEGRAAVHREVEAGTDGGRRGSR